MEKKVFGLIGKTLKHSFSKNYFTKKFENENIQSSEYELFELQTISEFPELIEQYKSNLSGLNVTIPYKREVMQYLDSIDEKAKNIDAVNTIKIEKSGELVGYNTDYYGFRNSITSWRLKNQKALILGTGGASLAIKSVLNDIGISFRQVSRKESDSLMTYQDINEHPEIISDHQLIINCTPLGTYPSIDEQPDIPYNHLTNKHFLFDLVYNPEITSFLRQGINAGAKIKNGHEMLIGQAEASWRIWNEGDMLEF